MVFTWSETKRAANIKAHGLDFLDVASVFEGATFSFEDDRFSTASNVSLRWACLLASLFQSYIRSEHAIRVISFRKATKRESQIYFDEIQN